MMNTTIISTADALDQFLAMAQPITETENVPTAQASGRVLATDILSGIDVPPHDNSSMDGYAVRVADCRQSGTTLRVAQRIPAGQRGYLVQAGEAARIFTGAPIPPGANAVVMQEDVQVEGNKVKLLVIPEEKDFIRYAGEDIRHGEKVLTAGTRLKPQHVGLAASVGRDCLTVCRRPRVAIFFTGNELIPPGEPLPPGSIYNSNADMLASLLKTLGCEVSNLGTIPDRLDATHRLLRESAQGHDLVVTTGGVSVGEEDHVRPAVEALGRLHVWRIAMKPGKPVAIGEIDGENGATTFIGLPGNPVSVFVSTLLFIRPFLLRMQGVEQVSPRALSMRADFSTLQPEPRNEFLRARINERGGLELFQNQSSGVLTSTVWGDGLIDNPPNTVIQAGDMLRFLSFNDLLYG